MATIAQSLAAPGDYIRCDRIIALPVTATANTDFVVQLPADAVSASYIVLTTVAYTAGTDAKISVGSTVGGVDYIAAVTIAAIGRAGLTPVNAAAAVHLQPGSVPLNIRVTQTGTATAVGLAYLSIQYSRPAGPSAVI